MAAEKVPQERTIQHQVLEYMEESQNPIEEESAPGRFLGNWRSCLLLVVMLFGILATPVAVFYRSYSDQTEIRLPTIGGDDGTIDRIAFITPDHQLATMSPDGGDVRRLTEMNRRFEFPAWAPGGNRLAVIGGDKVYVLHDSNGDLGQSQLMHIYENSQELPFYLYWSPDGQYVSFLASHPEGIALHLAGVGNGLSPVEMLAVGQPFYWDWAPLADRLLIHSGTSGADARLELIDLDGQTADGELGDPGAFQAPGISRSGNFQAFAALDDEGRSRLVIQGENGEREVHEAHIGQLAMNWSPASDVLAYLSPRLGARLGGGPLRLLDPATNESKLLSNENAMAFFWSPNGRTIAYFTLPEEDDSHLRVAEARSIGRVVARAQKQSSDLRLELWAVNVSSGNQRRLARFVPTNLFLRQFLPFFDQYSLSHRIWSPDSDALVIPLIEDGRSQIAVVPISRGSVQLVADGEIAFWSHQ
jgi:TolB protein